MNFKIIQLHGLQEADAIVLRKKFLGMVDHYAIYLGKHEGNHTFVANYTDGVKIVPQTEMVEILQTLQPTRIEKFVGSDAERNLAVKRALSRIGEKAYNYISNNCEHFKNWVHFGENRSEQVKVAGDAALIASGALAIGALASKNSKVGLLAGGLFIAGLLLHSASED